LCSVGCNAGNQASAVNQTPTTPTTPTVAVTTEIFTGQVDVAGKAFHPFTVALNGGAASVILSAAGPPATIFVGLGVGAYSATDNTCTLLQGGFLTTQAGATAQLAGTLTAGSYCVMVYDVGNQSAAITYSVTVNHY